MVRDWWKSVLVSPAVFGAMLVFGTTVLAEETPRNLDANQGLAAGSKKLDNLRTSSATISSKPLEMNGQDDQTANNELAQVTSVSQLSDVQPTDWAFQALQSLVERYGVIAGYPDGTYRGNRALTRYEFAAGLNAALDRVNELIAAGNADIVRKEDLATLQRLQEEFAAELATLRGRVDSLEAQAAELEANQFSTTTKLAGEVVVGVAGIVNGDSAEGEELDDSTVLVDRARLEFETSFTGNDLLYTRLATGNFAGFSTVTGTSEGELAFTQDENNDISAEVVEYSFPLTEQTEVFLAAAGGAFDDFSDTVNILDGDGGSGALSAFGTRNPIYYLGDGAGLGVRQQLGDSFELSLGYLAGEANNPTEGNGLFNGPYSAIGQLVFKPSDRFNIGLTYIHGYNVDNTGTGSGRTSFARFDDAFFTDNPDLSPFNVDTVSNSYGVQLSWRLSDRLVLGGWAGYTNTRLLSTSGGLFDRGDLDIWNYAVTVALPDFGREGNLLGFVVGMEPKVTNSTISSTNPAVDVDEDEDNSLHIEGFYQFQVTENISITPGVIWITAPGFNDDNNDLVIGALRTTFNF